jgi:hypothetical protein
MPFCKFFRLIEGGHSERGGPIVINCINDSDAIEKGKRIVSPGGVEI